MENRREPKTPVIQSQTGRQTAGHADRAKLFIPFDALKGFREALAERERLAVPRRELSEDSAEKLDQKLRRLRPGDMVTVLYYKEGEYVEQAGLVSRIDGARRTLRIVGTEIPFDEIAGIRID